MQLHHLTFVGPPLDDEDTLARVPASLAGLLRQVNGFIQFHGGLHVRGACRAPAWHSLGDAWDGEFAFHRLYAEVTPEDVPFAEDCLGDQFLLREGKVCRLAAETGDLAALEVSLSEFLQRAQDDPVEYLGMAALLQFQEEGGDLEPGQLLAAYPPFCTAEASQGVRLTAVPAEERRCFLAEFAARIRGLPDGGTISFEVTD